MLKRCIYNFPLFIIFIILCAVMAFFNGNAGNTKIWDDYYIVGIPEDNMGFVLEQEIFNDADIISENNTSFRFNDFGVFEDVALNDIFDRFVDSDPRIDPYMLGAESYFHTVAENGEKIKLVYVKSGLSPLNFYLKTRGRAGDAVSAWYFPDFNLMPGLYAAGLFMLCWFFGVWLFRGQRIPALIAGIPWFIAVIVNGPELLPAAASLYIFLLLLVKEAASDLLYYLNHNELRLGRNLFFYSFALTAALFFHIYLNITSGASTLPIFVSLAADFVCFFSYYSLKSQKVRMQEHRLFFPVSISKGIEVEKGLKKIPEITAAVTAVIIIPMFVLFINYKAPIEVPVPQESTVFKDAAFEGWTWESLNHIDKTHEGLVNAADLVTHTAFQEGFMYGREWKFPIRDETITAGRYVIENNEILFKQVNIRQFTDKWYFNIIDSKYNTGLTALLLSQNSPGGIILQSDISDKNGNFNPVRHILISLMVILPIFGQFLVKVNFSMRRKGQEA